MAIRSVLAGCAVICVSVLATEVAQARVLIRIDAGVYSLAEVNGGPATDTVTVTVASGVASVKITGADTLSFSMQDISQPAGYLGALNGPYGIAPYFVASTVDPSMLPPAELNGWLPPQGSELGTPLKSVSWDPMSYDFLTLYETASGGGLTIGSTPSAANFNLVDLYQVSGEPGQLFTITAVAEPATWTMMILGLGGVGAFARSRRGLSARPVTA